VYLGARDFYDETVPGGAAAVRARIGETGDASLEEFLATPFVPGGWYDVLPIAPLSAMAARLRNISHAQLVRENAAWVAQRDLNGVYRILLSLSSVETVAKRLPALSMRYFDFGGADARTVRERVIETHRFGIPSAIAPWFVFATEGFVPVALKMAGATRVTMRCGPPRHEGVENGLPVVRLRFEIGWQS
jgi:hypothetical protein